MAEVVYRYFVILSRTFPRVLLKQHDLDGDGVVKWHLPGASSELPIPRTEVREWLKGEMKTICPNFTGTIGPRLAEFAQEVDLEGAPNTHGYIYAAVWDDDDMLDVQLGSREEFTRAQILAMDASEFEIGHKDFVLRFDLDGIEGGDGIIDLS